MIHFIRTDHIGRPVLATDSTGTVVWTASYDPFGNVQASTGTPATIRFPGQWFQAGDWVLVKSSGGTGLSQICDWLNTTEQAVPAG